jgi:hypothetical protein
MKATINGITYEGTYEEITAIVDRMTPQYGHNPYVPRKQGVHGIGDSLQFIEEMKRKQQYATCPTTESYTMWI